MAAQESRNNSSLKANDSNTSPNAPISRMIFPYYKPLQDKDTQNTMEFDSVFESGNLAIAIKVADNEYNCLC